MSQTTIGGVQALQQHPRNDFKSFSWGETSSLVSFLNTSSLQKVRLALAILAIFFELPRRIDVYERIFVATNPPEAIGRGFKKTSLCEHQHFVFL
jgi:hypothetical protein